MTTPAPAPACIAALPTELVLDIATHLPPPSKYALAQASRRFRALLLPLAPHDRILLEHLREVDTWQRRQPGPHARCRPDWPRRHAHQSFLPSSAGGGGGPGSGAGMGLLGGTQRGQAAGAAGRLAADLLGGGAQVYLGEP